MTNLHILYTFHFSDIIHDSGLAIVPRKTIASIAADTPGEMIRGLRM